MKTRNWAGETFIERISLLLRSGPSGASWRTLLVLGRVSNLPTVWSNCLAAWLLCGGGSTGRFLAVCAGASCVYVGGMYLNDWYDSGFDRDHRAARPIPSGKISRRSVGWWSAMWLAIGWAVLICLGWTTAGLASLLVLAVVAYDASHKLITFSPLVMALCRVLLYLAAGSAAAAGLTGLTVWSALALGSYVVGLSHVARREATGAFIRWWPLAFLAAPLLLAILANGPSRLGGALVLSGLLVLGCARSISHLVREGTRGIAATVSGLLAGIVLVDLLAVNPGPWPVGAIFLALFGLALIAQRFVPAT